MNWRFRETSEKWQLCSGLCNEISKITTENKDIQAIIEDTENNKKQLQERKAVYMKRIKSIKTIDLELEVEFINNRTALVPNTYELSEFWEGRVQIMIDCQ